MISWRGFSSGVGRGMEELGLFRRACGGYFRMFFIFTAHALYDLVCTCCYHGWRGQLLRVGGVSIFSAVVFPLGLWILVIVCNCRYCAEKYHLGNAAVVFNFNYDGARLFETIFPPLHLFCCTLLLGWESYLSRKGWHMLT